MQNLKQFMRRLFSLRNLAPLLIVVIAIIGSLGLHPFGIIFTSDQIIMALLAFLAIDSMVERLELLTNIEQEVKSISKSLSPKIASASFFRERDINHVRNLIDESRNEIFVAGITLDSMVTLVDVLHAKLKQGCKIRILALHPSGKAIQEMAKFFASSPEFMSARIKSNLDVLDSRLRQVTNGSLEIHVLDSVFTTGYIISDPTTVKGQMSVQLYNYWIRAYRSPLFELSSQGDKEWFPLYLRQYEKYWEHSSEYKRNPTSSTQ